MMKKVAVLGSTGSIGTRTLEMMRYNKDIQVMALIAGGNVELIEEQIRRSKSGLAHLWDEERTKELRTAVAGLDVRMASGMEGLIEVATSPGAGLAATAVVGMIGIRLTIAAVEAGKDTTLANKETLVTAGHIIMPLAREKGVKLLPVGLERSVIFQYLQGAAGNLLHKILLTALGGPFRGFTREQLKQARLEDASKHLNWSMGHKITVDSSTVVNKRLEVMEAHWLFGVEMDQVQVVVQPVSTIHSMIELEDGAAIAQLDTLDMKLPIQYALYYPERRLLPGDRLDFEKPTKISFEVPDMETFRGLKLVYETGRGGGTLPTAFSVVGEMAVAMFLEWKINYLAITDMIEGAMEHHYAESSPDVA